MINPHGNTTLTPLYVFEEEERKRIIDKSQNLPKQIVSSASAANAVMLGGGTPPRNKPALDQAHPATMHWRTRASLFSAGNMLSQTYPDGDVNIYTYDSDGFKLTESLDGKVVYDFIKLLSEQYSDNPLIWRN